MEGGETAVAGPGPSSTAQAANQQQEPMLNIKACKLLSQGAEAVRSMGACH